MGKILTYAENSNLMNIVIRHGGEKFKFNLFQEIKINESNNKQELLDQPSSYAFLTMLHKDLIKLLSDKKITEKKAYASAYIRYKNQINKETQRPNSDDVAKQKAELDPNYIYAQNNVIMAQLDVNRIGACVSAYEQRASLMQTLSANQRAERT